MIGLGKVAQLKAKNIPFYPSSHSFLYPECIYHPPIYLSFLPPSLLSFLAAMWLELRASHLLGRHSIT
jgi:hypothetical protein